MDKITKEMNIEEVVSKHPKTIETFFRYGMGCVGCQGAMFENIEQGALVHGIDVDKLIEDLNESIKDSIEDEK